MRIAIPERPGAPFISYPDYLDYRAQTTTLQSLTAFTNGRVTVTSEAGSYALTAAAVDPNFFETIGVRPLRGRTFTPDEGRSTDSAGLVAIVSYRAWQDLFGGADDIVGRAIEVNNQPATVIGVAPPNFRGTMLAERTDVWLPLLMYWSSFPVDTQQRWATDRNQTPVDMIGTPGIRQEHCSGTHGARDDTNTPESGLSDIRPPRGCRGSLCRDRRGCTSCGRSDVSRDLFGDHDAHRVDRVRERRQPHAIACGRTTTRDCRSPITRSIALESRSSASCGRPCDFARGMAGRMPDRDVGITRDPASTSGVAVCRIRPRLQP